MSEEEAKELKPLSKKHLQFINNYFIYKMNGTEAYNQTYKPKGGRDVARANASELLAKPSIKQAVEERMKEVHMSSERAIQLLSEHAEGDIGDALDITSMGYHIDLAKLKELGKTHLIKKVKQKTITINGKDEDKETFIEDIEFHDPQSALRDILKMQGKFKEQIDLTSGGKEITFKIVPASEKNK